jgi:hypothetical protein
MDFLVFLKLQRMFLSSNHPEKNLSTRQWKWQRKSDRLLAFSVIGQLQFPGAIDSNTAQILA